MPKSHSNNIENLQELFICELQDLLSTELQIIEALPKVIKIVNDQKLKQALKDHLAETKGQVERLKKISNILSEDLDGRLCMGIKGILDEADALIECCSPGAKDASIIAAAQRVEHYEITGYGTACAHAKILNHGEVADLLQETLEEEEAIDKKLTKLAEGSFFTAGINKQAMEEEAYQATSPRNSRSERKI